MKKPTNVLFVTGIDAVAGRDRKRDFDRAAVALANSCTSPDARRRNLAAIDGNVVSLGYREHTAAHAATHTGTIVSAGGIDTVIT